MRRALSLLLFAALSTKAGAQTADITVTDPAGDAIPVAGAVSPDLIGGSLRVNQGNLILRVDYAKGTWNPNTTLTFISLDVDQNVATGHPGTTRAGIVDRDLLGLDYFISVSGQGTSFTLARYAGCLNCFLRIDAQLAAFRLLGTDSFELELPLSLLGKQDANINFKVTSTLILPDGGLTAVLDFMPDADRAVATNQPVRFFTASPTPIAKGQTTTLRWATIAGTPVTIDNGVGQQPSSGTITVQPAQTTTYFLTVSASGVTRTAAVTVEVVDKPVLVATAMPTGIVQVENSGGGTDRVVITNIGGATSFPILTAPAFIQFSNAGAIPAGQSRSITLTGTAQAAGAYEGVLVVSDANNSLSIPVKLLSAPRPAGTVAPRAAQNRIDVISVPSSSVGGTVTFTNSGTATVMAIVTSDQPWLLPQGGLITIPAGGAREVGFIVDNTRRSTLVNIGSEAATLTLNYITPFALPKRDVIATDDSTSATTSVTLVSTPRPPVSSGSVPGLTAGQVATFIPGMLHTSSLVSDFFALNRFSTASLPSLTLIYTSTAGPALSQIAALGTVQPSVTVGFSDVVRTVFNNNSSVGTLQTRTPDLSKVAVSASVINTASAQGTFGGALVSQRSDRSSPDSSRLIVLPGLRTTGGDNTTLYVQEVSGGDSAAQISFFDSSGGLVGSASVASIPGFGLAEVPVVAPASAITATIANVAAGRLIARALVTQSSGDVTPLEDWNLRNGINDPQRVVIPFVTRRGTTRTELLLASPNGSAAGTLEFHSAAPGRRRAVRSTGAGDLEPAPAASKSITVGANTTVSLADVLSDLGVADAAAGALVYTPTAGAMPSMTARANSSDAGVPTATALPVVPLANALTASKSAEFGGIEDASPATAAKKTRGTYKTSFGLVETAGKSVNVRVTLSFTSVPSGSTFALRGQVPKDYTLQPNQVLHVPDMTTEILGAARASFGDLHGMRLDVLVTGGNGAVVPYVMTTENATGDPILRIE